MTGTAPPPPRFPVGWGVALGVLLLVPQLVLTVVVVRQPLIVGLAGFAMTVGFVGLGRLGYRLLRERVPPVGRGILFAAGAVATIAGALLWGRVEVAVHALGDVAYAAAIAPPAAIGLNLLVVATLGLWLVGVVFAIGAVVGAFRARRR